MLVYHVLSPDTVSKTLKYGLAYGQQGQFSKDPHAKKTNTFLDERRPEYWKTRNVSRLHCIYAYFALNGMISDIKTGLPQRLDSWHPPANSALLGIEVNPSTVYVGNLALYDDLANCLMDERRDQGKQCDQKAMTYWQNMYSLADIATYYMLDQPGLRRRTHAPAQLPLHLPRIEVLIPFDVPSGQLHPVSL